VELISTIAFELVSEVDPIITFPLMVALSKVPTLVKLDPVTVEFKVVPLNVPASALDVIEISALPSNATPLMFFGEANFVAVAAFPVVFWFQVGAFPDNKL
jgi:hypothetical protein